MLMHDAFGHRESQASSLGVQAAGHERVEDIGQHVGRDAGAIIFHRDRDPGLTVAADAPGLDRDFAAGADGVERVAKQVDEDLDQTVGIAGDEVIGRDVVGETGLRSFFVDGDQSSRRRRLSGAPGTGSKCCLRTREKSTRLSLILRMRCVTRSMRARRSSVAVSSEVSVSFSMEPCSTVSGVFSSCATLALSRPEADQAILRFQLAQRFLQFFFAFAQLDDGGVAGAHDLADLVARDQAVVNQLVLAIAMLGGLVGLEHEAQRAVHVERHDGAFKRAARPECRWSLAR